MNEYSTEYYALDDTEADYHEYYQAGYGYGYADSHTYPEGYGY